MDNFKVIETQEQLDEVLAEHLKGEREAIRKEYEGFLSPKDVEKKYKGFLSPEDVQKKYEGYLSPEEVSKKDAVIKGYEKESIKVRVAKKHGLPYEMADRLSGETEEEIEKDAGVLAGFLKAQNPYPEYTPDPAGKKESKKAALKRTLSSLKGE